MAVSARSTTGYFPIGAVRASDFGADIGFLCNNVPAAKAGLVAVPDDIKTLMMSADITGSSASYTHYFTAPYDCEICRVDWPGATVPGGFSALTAEIRVIKDGAAEVSAMYNDAAISIADGAAATLSCETDTALADSAQLWYLKGGDKVRVKVTPTSSSGTITGMASPFFLYIRRR